MTFLSRAPMAPGGFEHESYDAARRARGHRARAARRRRDRARASRRSAPAPTSTATSTRVGGWAESRRGGRAPRRARRARRGVAIRAAHGRALDDGRRRSSTAARARRPRRSCAAGAWAAAARARARAGSCAPSASPCSTCAPRDPSPFAARPLPGVRRRHLAHRLLRLPGHRRRHRQDRQPRHRHAARRRAPARARSPPRTRPRCARCSRDTFPALADAPIVAPPAVRLLRHARRALLDRAPSRRARASSSRPAARATRSSSRRCSAS